MMRPRSCIPRAAGMFSVEPGARVARGQFAHRSQVDQHPEGACRRAAFITPPSSSAQLFGVNALRDLTVVFGLIVVP